ncbi:hypothetical protein SE18_22090 [Herpetosiphon geysericola]|uniref:DNA primase n=1 Tax=Herpetosiphon geysericola TaxID=70996 RepID=A0A0P6XE34_9CHLR|nr:hypothetical protein SE18_22090 [Herpetosiphon geysericola]
MNSVIEDIKERIDIVSFISDYVPLRKAGRNWVGFCPFHSNTRTPAFTVFAESNSYHCFGCKASGTIFDFLMQREGIDFPEALNQLAARAGVQLRQRTVQDEQEDVLRSRMGELNAAAAKFWSHQLLQSPKAAHVRSYIEQRGLLPQAVEQFQLGYASDDWSSLLGYLHDRHGAKPSEVAEAGLALERENGGYYDRFRGRLMFPIHNPKGQVVGFGGRILGDGHPKYINSPQTLLFDKSSLLYGLYQARETIRSSDSVVVVEGYMDVIMAHQAGFRNVIAPMGTALTDIHASQLNKMTKRITLAMDGDAAGQSAALRGLETLRETLDTHVRPVPTASGLLRWERELDATIAIALLPDGRDPDDIVRNNPDDWRALIANAQPLMDFYLATLTRGLDLGSAKGKSAAVERLTPLLNQIADPVERAHYIQRLANQIKVDQRLIEGTISGEQPERQRKQNQRQSRPAAPPPVFSILEQEARREDFLLSLLIRFPQVHAVVSEQLRDDLAAAPTLRELWNGDVSELFERVENRVLWDLWRSAQAMATPNPIEWLETVPPELQAHGERLLNWDHAPPTRSFRVTREAEECLRPLRYRLGKRWSERLGQMIAAAEPGEQERLLEQAMALQHYLRATSEPRRSSYFLDTRDSLK